LCRLRSDIAVSLRIECLKGLYHGLTLSADMELSEYFIARDESVMRLIPPGKSIFGSSSGEIRRAILLDKDGELFSLGNEGPQFGAFVPAYYVVNAMSQRH
jgi:hypothetical protein